MGLCKFVGYVSRVIHRIADTLKRKKYMTKRDALGI
jgi:hypothetical protein